MPPKPRKLLLQHVLSKPSPAYNPSNLRSHRPGLRQFWKS